MPPDRIDPYRNNWWCSPGPGSNIGAWFLAEAMRLSPPLLDLYGKEQPHARFLSAEEKSIAENESRKLDSIPAAPDWIGQTAFSWARSHPDDPRSPEALHLAVRATHYACDTGASGISKRAFELLHRRYPQSEWARKTKYWY
jgi:hypothetical protein